MSPTQVSLLSAPYIPRSDALDRHDYGVAKNRKSASTGGGRAWSEDEEMYLVQTRLQKMPYKHIAAHLKKTELACRLHYHQLSHGSNRRKRAASCSSGSSHDQSPTQPMTTPSPAREMASRSVSPLGPSVSYGAPSSGIQLPSILAAGASSGLPAILPKPMAVTLPPPPPAHGRGYSPVIDTRTSPPPPRFHHAPPPLPPAPVIHNPATPPLRLDCSALPPPSMPAHNAAHVDVARLQTIYNAHRASFWAAIATDYGSGVSPMALEQVWKSGPCCNQHASPITPVSSPDNGERETHAKAQDKTRISSILGIDADPRTARDRDIVRRMEEERFGIMSAP